MKHYRPLLLQELDVRLPGLHLRRLRLNRHLPEVDKLAEHSHTFGQILCYLSGRGTIFSENESHEIGPGAAVFLPPRSVHSFRETSGRRPLCLVLDLDWRGSIKRGFSLARLGLSDTGSVRRELSGLTKLPDPNLPGCRLLVAATTLRILDILLRGLDILPPLARQTPSFVRQFDRLLRAENISLPTIAAMAERMGYQPDYLNRIFKAATGQTLREYRDAYLIEKARRLLRKNRRIGETAAALGFLDQNYFARWFKKHTGLQPRAFAFSGGLRPQGKGVAKHPR
ncbi:MAG: AraC family transcriptional regulator [Terrimicrobiaceae bacterium]